MKEMEVQIDTNIAFIMFDVLLSNRLKCINIFYVKKLYIYKIRGEKKVLALEALLLQNSAHSFDIEFHKSTEPIQIKHHENKKCDSS